MIALLRRDPAMRSLPRWLIIAPLFTSMMEGVRTLSFFKAPAPEGTLLVQQAVPNRV